MKFFLTLFVFFSAFISVAQDAYYAKYDWDKNPTKIVPTTKELTKDEFIVREKRSVQVLFEEIPGENRSTTAEFSLVHVIRFINTDKGIERNNKVYISNGPYDKVLVQKARVIRPDGKILELRESDIQEAKDEEGNVTDRYFALDGLEKGSVIEYLHFIKSEPDVTGSVIYLQSSVDKRKVELDVIIPSHWEYQFYPVNGMKNFEKDSLIEDVNRSVVIVENVEGVKEEDFSAYNASLQKCYYKLNKNLDSGKSNLINYTNLAKDIHASIYEAPSKKTLKKMKAMAKSVQAESTGLVETIRNLEYKLKSEINVIENNFDNSRDLAFVLDKKFTNEAGMTKLMAQMLKLMNIKHEIVLTIDNTDALFPSDYEGYNFLSEYLIYVNEADMYTGLDIFSRFGFPPSELTNTKGLFIEERTMNDLAFAVAKIKNIKGPEGALSIDEINSKVTFDGELTEPKIEIERIATGYKAVYPQYYLDFMEEERKKEAKEEFIKYVDDDAILENEVYENDNSKVAGTKPLIARANFVGRSFIEQAGNKILLKAGLLIGPQAEMYNTEERKLAVMAGYTRQYKRKIEIVIPEGYVVKNPEALNLNVLSKNKEDAGFISSYELKGNVLTVTILEYYNKVYFPVEEYKEYEKVINAAADFNKIVLVLDKK